MSKTRKRVPSSALRIGLIVGAVFGAADVVFTWLAPLQDDTIVALLWFYGPMFFVWAFASFRAAQTRGRFLPGVVTGVVVAFATFCVFCVLNLVRVNLFFDELIARADWQHMMARYRASDFTSLRMFVTLDYIAAVPFKIAAACVIGAAMGAVGAALARVQSWVKAATA